jgi:hypothetical protein
LDCRLVCKTCAFHDALQAGKQKEVRRRQIRRVWWMIENRYAAQSQELVDTEWRSPSFPRPKKSRLQKSKVKTILIAFFDINGIIHKEFVPEGQTVS